MKLLIALILLALTTFNSSAQSNLSKPSKSSDYTYIYKLDSAEALELYTENSISDSSRFFSNKTDSFYTDSGMKVNHLAPGYYVFVRTRELNWEYQYHYEPYFKTEVIAVNDILEVRVFQPNGEPATNVKVYAGKEMLRYDNDLLCFVMDNQLSYSGTLLTVSDGKTISYNNLRSQYQYPTYDFTNNNNEDKTIQPGYFILNKPKYLPGDTVKMKAFLLYRDGDVYKSPLWLLLKSEYGNSRAPIIATVHPTTPGAYVYEFILGDTLQLNRKYTLQLMSMRGNIIKESEFRLEDYKLRRNRFSAQMTKPIYQLGEKVKIEALAVDVSGMPIPDGQLVIKVRLQQIMAKHSQVVFVPDVWLDSLIEIREPLNQGEQIFELPDSIFPSLTARYEVKLQFTDGENERYEKTLFFTVGRIEPDFQMFVDNNRLHVVYKSGDSLISRRMVLKTLTSSGFNRYDTIQLPFLKRLSSTDFSFELYESDTPNNRRSIKFCGVKPADQLQLTGFATVDSVHIAVDNPDSVLFYFRLYKNKKLILKNSAHNFYFREKNSPSSVYHLRCSYVTQGSAVQLERTFYAEEKRLSLETTIPNEILPGQQVSVEVTAYNYKHQPLANVNLAAYSINSQFDNISIPDLPYMGKAYPTLLKKYSVSCTPLSPVTVSGIKIVSERFLRSCDITRHAALLDFSFTLEGYKERREKINFKLPEVAPFVFNKGISVPVYAVYIDDKPVFIHGLSNIPPYSFKAKSGLHKLQIRSSKCLYTIDSVVLTDSTKLFISINEAIRSQRVRCDSASRFKFSEKEIKKLAEFIMPVKQSYNNYFNALSLIQHVKRIQANWSTKLFNSQKGSVLLVGPLEKGFVKAMNSSDTFDIYFEPGYLYSIDSAKVFVDSLTSLPDQFSFFSSFGTEMSVYGERCSREPDEYAPVIKEELFAGEAAEPDYNYNYKSLIPVNTTQLKVYPHYGITNLWLIKEADPFRSEFWHYSRNTYSDYSFSVSSGKYMLIAINQKGSAAILSVYLKPQGTTHITLSSSDYSHSKAAVKLIADEVQRILADISIPNTQILIEDYAEKVKPYELSHIKVRDKKSGISGFVFDRAYISLEGVIVTAENDKQIFDFALSREDGFFDLPNLKDGYYKVRFTLLDYKVSYTDRILVKKGERTMIKIRLNEWKYKESVLPIRTIVYKEDLRVPEENLAGKGEIRGKIIDDKTRKPLDYASVVLKTGEVTIASVYTDEDGNYIFKNLAEGIYTIHISTLGYQKLIMKNVQVKSNKMSFASASLIEITSTALPEVRVVSRKAPIVEPMGASGMAFDAEDIIKMPTRNVNRIANTVAGVTSVNGGTPTFRGSRDDGTAYYIDGVRVQSNSQPVVAKMEKQMEYTLQTLSKLAEDKVTNRIRETFRDYGYWVPNLVTDKNGKATFSVTFPDNITQWQNILLAMDGKKHSGIKLSETKAFKPLSIILGLPRFMLVGDSAQFFGRTLSYLNDSVNVELKFDVNGKTRSSESRKMKGSFVARLPYIAEQQDTLQITYSLSTPQGYTDGEKLPLPVLRKSVSISNDSIVVLDNDTIWQITASAECLQTHITINNKKYEWLKEEINKLKNYRYGCMEQTTSKLKALLLEKKLNAFLKLPFTDDATVYKCIKILEKNQLDNGAWTWWGRGDQEEWVTFYVGETLNKAATLGYKTRALPSFFNYISANLHSFSVEGKTRALLILHEQGATLDYTDQIHRIEISLQMQNNLNAQTLLYLLKKRLGQPVETGVIFANMQNDQYGGIYWKGSNSSINSGNTQATLLAYRCLAESNADSAILSRVRQHFFHPKGYKVHFRNTLESASVLEALLADVAESQNAKEFKLVKSITVSGSQQKLIKDFPARITLKPQEKITFTKSPGELDIHLTEERLQENPPAKGNEYTVYTYLRQGKKISDTLVAGESAELVVKVSVKQLAEYVMIDVPIPAGTIYAQQNAPAYFESHRENFRNTTGLFCRQLSTGNYEFVIKLEARFPGSYTLLPATIQSMYEPDLVGNNQTRKVVILQQK